MYFQFWGGFCLFPFHSLVWLCPEYTWWNLEITGSFGTCGIRKGGKPSRARHGLGIRLLRIIGGSLKGRTVKSPKGTGTRPTTDRVREAIFNIIAPYIPDCVFLDLFAGSGAIGIEALSRGARQVVFVEKSRRAALGIKGSLAELGLVAQAEVITGDVWTWIPKLAGFDLVFADPPFDQGHVPRLLEAVRTSGVLKPGGLLVIEHSQRESPGGDLPGLALFRQRKYGSTKVSVFGKEEKES